MNDIFRIIIFCIGLSLCTWVITLLARKKINERNTLVWIGGVILVLILSTNPEWLDVVASWAGVSYPPSLLFLCAFIVLLIITLYQSIQISHLYARIKDISQAVALQNEKSNNVILEEDKIRLNNEG
ncbi:MAG: DUF2304 domain-containing protein [Paenibacillaceae bacterium]